MGKKKNLRDSAEAVTTITMTSTVMAMEHAATLLQAVSRRGIDQLELEWRLGHRGHNGFVPGLPETAWHRLSAALTAAGHAWTESQSTEYVDPRSGAKFVVWADGRAHWKTKERLVTADVDAAVRMSAALETERPADRASYAPVPGVFTRHKERKSFVVDRAWSVDLTRVASSADIDADVCGFEVEVELRDPDILFVRPVDNVVQWGTALAHQMLYLAGMAM